MSAKTLQAKVVCADDSDYSGAEKLQFLWATHRLFNECLRPVISTMMAMKRGEKGPLAAKWGTEVAADLQVAFRHMMDASAQQAHGIMEPLTGGKSRSGERGGEGAKLARSLRQRGVYLFDRYELFPVSAGIWRKLFQLGARVISSHYEKVNARAQEREQWESDRGGWIERNGDFWDNMYPRFRAFEEQENYVRGITGREVKRGHKLAAFLEHNPDLKEHVRTLLTYNAEYRPERKPGLITFTLPSVRPLLRSSGARTSGREHPIWVEFQKEVLYKDLDVQRGTVRMLVFVPRGQSAPVDLPAGNLDPAQFEQRWITCSFRGDPRLKRLTPAGDIAQRGRRKFPLEYEMPGLPDPLNPTRGLRLPAEVRGLKLIFRRDQAYLYFTIDLKDRELPVGITWDAEARKRGLPDELSTVAVDLGQRHTACVTLLRRAKGQASNVPDGTCFIRVPGAELPVVGIHQRDLGARLARSSRGTPGRSRHSARGLPSFVALRAHLAGTKAHRYKKAAHEIVSFAARHGARVIIMERLQGYQPQVENPRVVNRNLMNWNRRLIFEFTQQLARPAGISVRQVPAQWSSQICSRCGHPGARFAIVTRQEAKSPWGRQQGLAAGAPLIRRGGPLFCCGNRDCKRIVNADFNASMNLQRRFHGAWTRVEHCPERKNTERQVQEILNLRFASPDAWDSAVAERTAVPLRKAPPPKA